MDVTHLHCFGLEGGPPKSERVANTPRSVNIDSCRRLDALQISWGGPVFLGLSSLRHVLHALTRLVAQRHVSKVPADPTDPSTSPTSPEFIFLNIKRF